jgi:cell division protein FtsB
MPDAKRPDPKRRSPASRPSAAGRSGDGARGRPAKSSATRREPRQPTEKAGESNVVADENRLPAVIEPIRQSIADSAEQQSEQRLGFTARRAAILAAVVCVLTLTIAGPVRTYFAQRTEMSQLAATEKALRAQISDLQEQKDKLADPVFIAAQARERLGFVMPGDIPFQVQLPPGAIVPTEPGTEQTTVKSTDPWYTSLWKTIADTPHGEPTLAPTAPLPGEPLPGEPLPGEPLPPPAVPPPSPPGPGG